MTSEPAAPNTEATLLCPRYRPIRNLPIVNSRAVIAAPTQTSRHAIFTSGRKRYIMAKSSVTTASEMTKCSAWKIPSAPGIRPLM
jgi:hypothetical protein